MDMLFVGSQSISINYLEVWKSLIRRKSKYWFHQLARKSLESRDFRLIINRRPSLPIPITKPAWFRLSRWILRFIQNLQTRDANRLLERNLSVEIKLILANIEMSLRREISNYVKYSILHQRTHLRTLQEILNFQFIECLVFLTKYSLVIGSSG